MTDPTKVSSNAVKWLFLDCDNRDADGPHEWRHEGYLHRDDGPAYIDMDGTQEWWQYGQRHRVDGPAIIYPDGTERWYEFDQLHRVDGPALTDKRTGTAQWYVRYELVDIEETRPGVFDKVREKAQREKFTLTAEQMEKFDFRLNHETAIRTFLHVKDNLTPEMLSHPNAAICAVAAWHLPVDADYLAAALESDIVSYMMQHRPNVPDDMRTLWEAAS